MQILQEFTVSPFWIHVMCMGPFTSLIDAVLAHAGIHQRHSDIRYLYDMHHEMKFFLFLSIGHTTLKPTEWTIRSRGPRSVGNLKRFAYPTWSAYAFETST